MKVLVRGNDVLIQTKYNENIDLVQQYQYNDSMSNNKNFSSKATYLVPNYISLDSDLSAYLIHNTNDSIAALESVTYWFLLGQHGYYIPRVVSKGNRFSVGEIVESETGERFKVIEKAGDFLFLAPNIREVRNNDTRSWTFKSEKFKKLRSGSRNYSASVTEVTGYQVPMLNRKEQKIFINNRPITKLGEFQCNDVELVDTFVCVNPKDARFDGVRSMSGDELIEISQSYYFKQNSVYSATKLKVKSSIHFVKYHGIQPTGLIAMGEYVPYAMFPKVKAQPASLGRQKVDWNYPTNVDDPTNDKYSKYLFRVNENDIESVNDIPDRTIQFLRNNEGDFKVGFASGFDLETGLTAKHRRPKLVHEAFHIATNLNNKTYFRALTAERFKDGMLPVDYTGQFNGYFAYYKPSESHQSYVVHKKEYSYIYIHTQKQFDKKKVSVDNLENKSLSVIEFKGINLLSEKIINGHIYIQSLSERASYIVLKTN